MPGGVGGARPTPGGIGGARPSPGGVGGTRPSTGPWVVHVQDKVE